VDGTTERIEADEEGLPYGGAYAIAQYRDETGMPCPKAEAKQAEVVEYSSSGKPIAVYLIDIGMETDDDA
jgi:hypothetical protein